MQKSGKRKLFIFLGAVLVVAVLVVANLKRSGGNKVTVQTDEVKRGEITSSVSGSAKIQPEVQVKISAKVSGQIIRLDVKEGDSVKKGDFLCQLDPVNYQKAVEQSESNVQYAQAGLEKAKSEYDRAQKLFADQLVSEAELEIAKSTFQQSQASYNQAKAALDQAEDNLSKTTLYAPMDGTVSQLNKKLGEMAMGSQFTLDVIMIVADLNKMLAETEIDENDVVAVSLGDTSEIVVDAFPDSVFIGVVTEIANTGLSRGLGTQEEVTNFLVKVAMIDLPERLRPGMSATVDIMTDKRLGALKVPIQCVTMRKPLDESAPGEEEAEKDVDADKEEVEPIKVIFVIEEGVAHQKAVETGISSDTEWEIVSGIEEGDEVVSGSYRILSKQLKDGNEVKVDNSLKKMGRDDD